MLDGWRRRHEARWELGAQVAAWVMAPWVKRPKTAAQLLGWAPKKRR